MPDATQEPRGWDLSSTCVATNAAGEAQGRKVALAETGAMALAQVLASQGRRKFGSDHAAGKALLDSLAAARAVDRLRQLGASLVEATDWDHWLAGMEAPPPAPQDYPEYSLDAEIDIEPPQPCIDLTAQCTSPKGETVIVQVRLQKWYQPDLGKILYNEARRLEKRFKGRTRMAVVLLWPSADGPAVTGRYQTTDFRGRPVTFRYDVRRAWEMPPEESLASVGTLMLVPLSRGARERMPELVRLARARLEQIKPDPQTRSAVLATFYFAMGMVCPLEEAHQALGDLLPVIEATTDYKKAYGEAFRKGYGKALQEGPCVAVRDLVARQARQRFGEDPASQAVLEALASLPTLTALASRALTAGSWAELVEGTNRAGSS